MSPPLQVALVVWLLHAVIAARKDKRYIRLLTVCFATLAGGALIGKVLALSASLTPKYDLYLFAVDHAWGFSASFELGRMMGASTRFFPVLATAYDTMLLAMLLVYELHYIHKGEPARVLAAFVANLCVGFAIYFVLPACGPAYAFRGSFPRMIPPWEGVHPLQLAAPPNAIPSVHTSTALLALWFCRRHPVAIVVALVNLAGILLATLASGEHYLIDLVVGVPFAAAIFHASGKAWRPAVAWAAVTMAWMLGLRFGSAMVVASPVMLGVAAAGTAVLPWITVMRESRA